MTAASQPEPASSARPGEHEAGAALVRWLALLLALIALALGLTLWQRIGNTQEQLAQQSAESLARAVEARTMAREAQALVRDDSGKIALLEARVSEVSVQRAQIEELLYTLSRSRDDNLVVDLESTLRFAQQQAQLTGSVAPLVVALKSSVQRIERAAQPRLSEVQRAIERDLEKINTARVVDTPTLALKIDDVERMIDELPAANAVGSRDEPPPAPEPEPAAFQTLAWWQRALGAFADETRKLVRVSRIDQPEAALLAPQQIFFLRENLKLKLLNARLALLARHLDSARADLTAADDTIVRYFDTSAHRSRVALGLLQQVRAQAREAELPRIDDTLAALSTAAAGR